MGTIQVLSVDQIETRGTQTRAHLDEETLVAYADAWTRGDNFPPLDVFQDGRRYWLGGGFHRLEAAKRAKRASVPAHIQAGNKTDAIRFGFRDNDRNGLRRSNADKRYAVSLCLNDPDWSKLSSRAIAELTGVHRDLVDTMRREGMAGGDRTPRGTQQSDSACCDDGGVSEDLTTANPEATRRTGLDGRKRRLPNKRAETADISAPTEPDAPEEPTLAESCEADNKLIESFCRNLVKHFEENVPHVFWAQDSGRIDSALANVRAACATLRTAKAVVCPGCDEGRTAKGKCRYCQAVGYLPTHQAQQIPPEAKR